MELEKIAKLLYNTVRSSCLSLDNPLERGLDLKLNYSSHILNTDLSFIYKTKRDIVIASAFCVDKRAGNTYFVFQLDGETRLDFKAKRKILTDEKEPLIEVLRTKDLNSKPFIFLNELKKSSKKRAPRIYKTSRANRYKTHRSTE